MNATGPADPTDPHPALMSALTTEHYTLQSARTSTIVEANGRSMLFLSSVSGATVALALVAQLDRMGDTFVTFALTVLPALLALGLTSYSRLADLAVHDAYYARAIGRIRAFYLTIEPSAQQYWLVPAGDDAHAVMRQAGQPHSRWHHLGHTATAVAAVVGVITGAFLGVLGSVVTPLATSVLAASATVAAVAAFAGLLADQERRWRRSDDSRQSHFLPDGTPTMSVNTVGDRTSRAKAAAPHSRHWQGRTAPGQKQARPPAEPEPNRRPGTPAAPDSEGSVFEMAASPSTEEEAGRRASSALTHEGTSQHETSRELRRTRSNQPPLQHPKGRRGRIVVGSLASGLLAAGVLAAMPFVPAEPSELTGAVLCGFAVGWAMLAVLSVRLTDQPQRWAWAPAGYMGLGGLALIAFGSGGHDVLRWVWPAAMLALSIWMIWHIRRDMGTRFGRWLLYPLVALLAVVAVGAGTETVQSATSAQPEMPGQLIDVGGHRLHLNCTGSGSPTVVLEPGAGMSSSTTGWITPAVAPDTRICVYDRAGRGWSDPADTTQDATQVVTDLHTLLQRANVPGPYVLAGHSFGGLYALTYAAQYPGEVAGMVLIDSTAPVRAPIPPTRPASTYDPMGRLSALLSSTTRFGLMRLVVGLSGETLPPASEEAERASLATSEHWRSTIDEYRAGGTSAKEAAALTSFNDKPLFVLTAGEGSSRGWMPKQDKLAALSTNSAHQVVEGAAHADFLIEERAASATSKAILDVVAAVRTGDPLGKR